MGHRPCRLIKLPMPARPYWPTQPGYTRMRTPSFRALGKPIQFMILHVDMDAFYASVEEREQPELAGKPVIVGGTPQGRGVVAAANYAARQFGIHSAMASATAFRLCPHAVVLPPRMEFYAAVSQQIRDIFHRYTPLVEPLSLDEAFLNATESTQLFGSVEEIGRRIKQEIRSELSLVASVGVAPNKFLAKLASDLEKPDGFTVIRPDAVQQTLDPLPVSRIWGVGKMTARRLADLGITSIRDLRKLDRETLTAEFGASGTQFWRLARGIDTRPVVADRDAKSVSHETTFAADIDDIQVLRAWLLELTEQVGRRLRRSQRLARTVHLKLRYDNFETITRTRRLTEPAASTRVLWDAVNSLLTEALPPRRLSVRLIGMGTSGLSGPMAHQQTLFDQQEPDRDQQIDDVADQIRAKFGSAALRRGLVVEHDAAHRPQPRPKP